MTMRQKQLVTFVVMALLCSSATAATLGADAKQVTFDPKTGTAVFEIRNLSNKDITAFNISISAVYVDGKTLHSERVVDLSPAIMSNIDQGDLSPGSGSLHPGATEEETVKNSPVLGDNNSLQSLEGVVDVVVYADRSAEVRNQAAFDRILSVRQTRAKTLVRVNDILSKHLASNEQDPIKASNNDLQNLLSEAGTRPQELDSTEILATLDDLHHLPKNASTKDFLVRYSDQKQKHVAQATASAQIEVTK